MVLFKAKEQPRFEEAVKVIGIKKVRKAIAHCDLYGKESEQCKNSFKELGIDLDLNE